MSVRPIVAALRGGLVVSVQAYPGEPLRHPETMAQMARACELGGAAAIRCQGRADIAAVKGRVEVPVIGLWKEGHEGVFITPTLRHDRGRPTRRGGGLRAGLHHALPWACCGGHGA